MWKNLAVFMLCIFFFFAGSIWGKFNFITSDIYQSTSPITVSSKIGEQGVIPKNTELHLHSSAHKRKRYFLFIDISDSESKLKVIASNHDENGGIKFLKSVVE
jgi:hypothetical protein